MGNRGLPSTLHHLFLHHHRRCTCSSTRQPPSSPYPPPPPRTTTAVHAPCAALSPPACRIQQCCLPPLFTTSLPAHTVYATAAESAGCSSGRYLVTGGQDGSVTTYDVSRLGSGDESAAAAGDAVVFRHQLHADSVNGIRSAAPYCVAPADYCFAG